MAIEDMGNGVFYADTNDTETARRQSPWPNATVTVKAKALATPEGLEQAFDDTKALYDAMPNGALFEYVEKGFQAGLAREMNEVEQELVKLGKKGLKRGRLNKKDSRRVQALMLRSVSLGALHDHIKSRLVDMDDGTKRVDGVYELNKTKIFAAAVAELQATQYAARH